ncbi:MAG: histidine kinase [Bacillota bacterium]|nr:histidine kinase [Bacillota bacterium]
MHKKRNIYILCILTITLFAVVFITKNNIFNLYYDSYLRSPEQISKRNYFICGYDSFILGMYVIIILFNAFYYLFRKEKSFIILILLSFMMMLRTMIYGSHFIYYIFPQVSAGTLLYIDNITLTLLPFSWIAITHVCLPVNIPKSVIKFTLAFAIVALGLLFIIPVSYVKQFEIIVGVILLFTCIYITIKAHSTIITQNIKPIPAALISTGITVIIIATMLDIIRIVFFKSITIGYIPTGFMLLAVSWEYYFTYSYEMLMKDRLRVLEELNVLNENNCKLEMKFLKSQIRPHFIHNALNTIIAISRTDANKSKYLLYEFSNYLRSCYDIEGLEDVISIEHEISFTRAYATLEQARFEDNLHIEYHLDDVEIDVPPLILQPLAENAIVHNQADQEKPLYVSIYVTKLEDSVKIGVQDNGDGIDKEKVQAILSGETSNRGVGLNNINQRLNKIYGTKLHIESSKESGTNVFMIIPLNGGSSNFESNNY